MVQPTSSDTLLCCSNFQPSVSKQFFVWLVAEDAEWAAQQSTLQFHFRRLQQVSNTPTGSRLGTGPKYIVDEGTVVPRFTFTTETDISSRAKKLVFQEHYMLHLHGPRQHHQIIAIRPIRAGVVVVGYSRLAMH